MVDSLPCHGRGSGFDSRLARVMIEYPSRNVNGVASSVFQYGYPSSTPTVKKVTTTVCEYDEKGNLVKETITETEYAEYSQPYTIYNV